MWASFHFVTEVSVDAPESSPPTPLPTTETSTADPPVINITVTDSPAINTSSDSWPNRSSASQSSISSTTQSEVSSSDMSIQVRANPSLAVPNLRVVAKGSINKCWPIDRRSRLQMRTRGAFRTPSLRAACAWVPRLPRRSKRPSPAAARRELQLWTGVSDKRSSATFDRHALRIKLRKREVWDWSRLRSNVVIEEASWNKQKERGGGAGLCNSLPRNRVVQSKDSRFLKYK